MQATSYILCSLSLLPIGVRKIYFITNIERRVTLSLICRILLPSTHDVAWSTRHIVSANTSFIDLNYALIDSF
jgi:hypothetical protein